MSDLILIRQLQVDAIIGIHEFEKQATQPLLFDLDLGFDCSQAAQSDDIKDALDYFAVCETITKWVTASRCELLETMATQLLDLLFAEFPCESIQLTIHKPQAVGNAQAVGLRLFRQRPAV